MIERPSLAWRCDRCGGPLIWRDNGTYFCSACKLITPAQNAAEILIFIKEPTK